MRGGWISGLGAAGGTMLLLIAAAMIAQPNVRVLDGVMTKFFEGEDETAQVEAVVDNLTVEPGRVRGRVRNPSSVALGEVVVHVRLIPAEGDPKTTSATVYGLGPGGDAWFGIPLVGGPAIERAELVEVRATAGAAAATPQNTAPQRHSLPAPSRRSGVGGMQDVQRIESDMKKMEEATRAATGGQ